MSATPLEPFSTQLDLGNGTLAPERHLIERRLRDLDGLYRAPVPSGRADELSYTVSEIPAPRDESNLMSSTTVLQPGRVGDEFAMTKGHFHAVRERAEIYVGLAGEGRLIMALQDGTSVVETMTPGSVSYVPGHWAHRTVNVGAEPLVFYAVYPGDAGYDYGTIETAGFPVLVVERDGRPEVVDNPDWKRPDA